MTWHELLRRLRANGWTGSQPPDGGAQWREMMGKAGGGTGNWVTYTETDLRILTAWIAVQQLCGLASPDTAQLHRDAAAEIAEHRDGWVVITEGTVNWTRRPTARVFDRGAVCIPVPG